MEFKDFLLLFAGAVLGYLVQLVGDRWRNISDDYELWAELQTVSIETRDGGIGNDLAYAWKGRTLEHPHISDLYVWSVGRRDITSNQFDAGRSLSLDFGAPIVGEIQGGKFVGLEETKVTVSQDGVVAVAPSIIRRRMAGHYRFITDGEPHLSISNPIADLALVRQVRHEKLTLVRRTLGPHAERFIAIGIVVMVASPFITVAIAAPFGWTASLPAPFVLAMLLGILGGAAMLIAGGLLAAMKGTDPRRVSRALRILRRSLGEKGALVPPTTST